MEMEQDQDGPMEIGIVGAEKAGLCHDAGREKAFLRKRKKK